MNLPTTQVEGLEIQIVRIKPYGKYITVIARFVNTTKKNLNVGADDWEFRRFGQGECDRATNARFVGIPEGPYDRVLLGPGEASIAAFDTHSCDQNALSGDKGSMTARVYFRDDRGNLTKRDVEIDGIVVN